jgi:hypothetical protein
VLADTLIARALTCDGLSYGDGRTRQAYLLHQYPTDTPFNRNDMGKRQSGCLLHVRSLLAAEGVAGEIDWRGRLLDVLRAPYAGELLGTIETILQELARQRGLLTEGLFRGAEVPELLPADLVVIGQGGRAPVDPIQRQLWQTDWGGVAHGFLVTGVSDDKIEIESSDGGQTDKLNSGYPTAIRRVVRRLERRRNGWWLVSDDGRARRLNWRLRCSDLPLR